MDRPLRAALQNAMRHPAYAPVEQLAPHILHEQRLLLCTPHIGREKPVSGAEAARETERRDGNPTQRAPP
ncbi:hypothetical protein [Asaia platycodi]|uniref:hypothetical protein n=1 Tax=Asaia platycodi TaxID=610243 RepID=UPI00046E9CC8|nr:hypothetical protein [Asaia platycodi]